MTRIVANMVVRNEADHYLKQVLARLTNQVDDIIVTDDCSDDDTAGIAESFGAKVQRLDKPTFKENEGQLRQLSWNWLEQNLVDEDTLVLAIDADEELYETNNISLRDLANLKRFKVFNVVFFHMWNELQYRTDGGWRPHGSTRLFRYEEGGQFKQSKLACGSEPTYVFNWLRTRNFMPNSGMVMKHLSYIKDVDKARKYERYMDLDGGAFHANAHIQSIMDPFEKVQLEPWRWG
jgi:glycosyltransferase involved in cell wall biosynthesis